MRQAKASSTSHAPPVAARAARSSAPTPRRTRHAVATAPSPTAATNHTGTRPTALASPGTPRVTAAAAAHPTARTTSAALRDSWTWLPSQCSVRVRFPSAWASSSATVGRDVMTTTATPRANHRPAWPPPGAPSRRRRTRAAPTIVTASGTTTTALVMWLCTITTPAAQNTGHMDHAPRSSGPAARTSTNAGRITTSGPQ